MKITHYAKAKRYKKKVWNQSHPKTGAWNTKKFIHGPRLKQPEDFKSIYLIDQDFAKKRHVDVPKKAFNEISVYAKEHDLDLVKDWKHKARIKAGETKGGQFEAQSILTPIKKNRGSYEADMEEEVCLDELAKKKKKAKENETNT